MPVASAEAVLRFWLDEVGPDGWYEGGAAVDEAVRERFRDTWAAAAAGALDGWSLRPDAALALVVALDQFPRNMFRGSEAAFASDAKALDTAKRAIAAGHDLRAGEPERQFFYLPLMHAESLADQDRCVRLILTRMPKTGHIVLPHARAHRDVIRRFGRFPYRNAALGRPHTSGERSWMEAEGHAA